jgi:hypothetical protein
MVEARRANESREYTQPRSSGPTLKRQAQRVERRPSRAWLCGFSRAVTTPPNATHSVPASTPNRLQCSFSIFPAAPIRRAARLLSRIHRGFLEREANVKQTHRFR